ncbi:hypothetical protein BVC80_8593g8 [Macleaya cordata]|uniref:Thioredoxin-like fold n=1 Tax=Macleaya cordata TaxID=56857 RepID=A0A200PP89_MACCD|nr:hypothetical protein BVC80_8593g8 [Macleaya cordata]
MEEETCSRRRRWKQSSQSLLLISAALVLIICSSSSPIIIPGAGAALIPPAKFDGFVYKNHRAAHDDSVIIEAFFDPVCPDSRDAWPPLKRALQHYGSRLSLIVHPFALPSVLFFLYYFCFFFFFF